MRAWEGSRNGNCHTLVHTVAWGLPGKGSTWKSEGTAKDGMDRNPSWRDFLRLSPPFCCLPLSVVQLSATGVLRETICVTPRYAPRFPAIAISPMAGVRLTRFARVDLRLRLIVDGASDLQLRPMQLVTWHRLYCLWQPPWARTFSPCSCRG